MCARSTKYLGHLSAVQSPTDSLHSRTDPSSKITLTRQGSSLVEQSTEEIKSWKLHLPQLEGKAALPSIAFALRSGSTTPWLLWTLGIPCKAPYFFSHTSSKSVLGYHELRSLRFSCSLYQTLSNSYYMLDSGDEAKLNLACPLEAHRQRSP